MSHRAPHIRRVRTTDHAQIRALAVELLIGMSTWRPREGQRAAVVSWVDSALAGADGECNAVFVSVTEETLGVVSGFVSVVERTHFTGQREGYVGELVVAPWCRRFGVGRALMGAAEDWASRRGLTCISLETGAGNTAARRAYARLGYLEEQVTLTKTLA